MWEQGFRKKQKRKKTYHTRALLLWPDPISSRDVLRFQNKPAWLSLGMETSLVGGAVPGSPGAARGG